MTNPEPTIRVVVDPTNPGQFFACCGLLELADRRWPGAQGWFASSKFHIAADGSLPELVQAIVQAALTAPDAEPDLPERDIYSTRVQIGNPFRPLLLDWWHEMGGRADAKDLKVWAGTMESYGIANAMRTAMKGKPFHDSDLLNIGMVVPDPSNPAKKKEPYYFDSRRGPNAHSRDVGFSPNDLDLTTTAFPAVEFLCLVGLQRCQPVRVKPRSRLYDYVTWTIPLPPSLLPTAVAGHLGGNRYRFENWFRTGQKKHKAFRPAVPLTQDAAHE